MKIQDFLKEASRVMEGKYVSMSIEADITRRRSWIGEENPVEIVYKMYARDDKSRWGYTDGFDSPVRALKQLMKMHKVKGRIDIEEEDLDL